MCLDISKVYHKKHHAAEEDYREVFVAEEPILVIKGLDLYRDASSGTPVYRLESPYRNYKWEFEKPEYANMRTRAYGMRLDIGTGVHALVSLEQFYGYFWTVLSYYEASQMLNDNAALDVWYEKGATRGDAIPFPAVIPKGAKFWVGDAGDICADGMTVYPSLNAVRAANGGELPVWAGTYIDAL